MRTWGYTFWPWFLVVVSVVFLVAEIYALVTNDQDTLSYYTWHELRLTGQPGRMMHNAAWFLTQGVFIVLVLWLWRHIWYMQYR